MRDTHARTSQSDTNAMGTALRSTTLWRTRTGERQVKQSNEITKSGKRAKGFHHKRIEESWGEEERKIQNEKATKL